jgi:BlaI family transcriptional regulator, penicillinase repressor
VVGQIGRHCLGEEVDLAENEPSPREVDVLKALWALGSGSVREVHKWMCPDGELAFNTIQTLLRIMEDKGLIRHRSEGRTFIYEPIYSRDRVTARLLHRVFDGAIDEAVLSLLQAKDATEEELRALERMIAEARKRKASQNKRRTEGK